MKSIYELTKNENGSALMITIMALITLTVLGVIAIKNSTTELSIAGNERQAKLAFFTAESARGYVVGHGELYGDNVMAAGSTPFPDGATDFDSMKTDNYVQLKDPDGDGTSQYYYCLDYPSTCSQMFRGTVRYDNWQSTSQSLEDFGMADAEFAAYIYVMECEGYFDSAGAGNSRANKNIEQGFFRLGLNPDAS